MQSHCARRSHPCLVLATLTCIALAEPWNAVLRSAARPENTATGSSADDQTAAAAKCPAGKYIHDPDDDMLMMCQCCHAGRYQPQASKTTACKQCPAGKHMPRDGTGNDDDGADDDGRADCPANSPHTECKDCPAGKTSISPFVACSKNVPTPPPSPASHYGDPCSAAGCRSDEYSTSVTGVAGSFCTSYCTSSTCPTDVPAGVTAVPQCALTGSDGSKSCALICSPTAVIMDQKVADTQCGSGASCKSASGEGVCTYDDCGPSPSPPTPPSPAPAPLWSCDEVQGYCQPSASGISSASKCAASCGLPPTPPTPPTPPPYGDPYTGCASGESTYYAPTGREFCAAECQGGVNSCPSKPTHMQGVTVICQADKDGTDICALQCTADSVCQTGAFCHEIDGTAVSSAAHGAAASTGALLPPAAPSPLQLGNRGMDSSLLHERTDFEGRLLRRAGRGSYGAAPSQATALSLSLQGKSPAPEISLCFYDPLPTPAPTPEPKYTCQLGSVGANDTCVVASDGGQTKAQCEASCPAPVASEKERNMYIVWFVLSLLLCFGTVFFADDEPSGGALATGMIHVLVAVGFWVAYVHSGGESHERSFFVVLTVLGLVVGCAAVNSDDDGDAVGMLVNLCIFIAGAALWGSYNHGHPVVNPYHCPQGYLDQNGTCVPPPTPAPTPSPTPPVLPTPPPAPPLIKACTGASTGLHPDECEAWQALDYTLAGLVASSCSATDPCGCPTNASVFASCSSGPDGNVTHITVIRLAAPSGTQIYNTSAINPEQRAWDNFPQLTSLALHGNPLGQLVQQPSSLGPMNDLQSLVMNDLMISSIPHWIANVPSLSTLDLGSNALSDDVPWDGVLCKLASLTRLVLSNNKIRGSVPRCIGQLNRLVELDLGTNDFNGTIPSEIGNLTALAMLDVSANGMDGTIPFEVLRSLTTLRASDNRFSGPISWGSLNPSLRELVLHGNSLVGTIASSVDKLTELAVLDLGSNDMQGMVPWFALTSAGSIRGLRLQGNTFGGAVPKVTNEQDNLWFNMTACTNTGDATGQDPTAPCCDISGNTFTFAWSKDSKVYVESHCDAAQIQHFAHSYSSGLVAVSLSFLGLWLLLDMVRLFKGQRKRSLSAMKVAELHEKGGAYENVAAFVQKSGCAQLYDSLVHVVKTPGFLALFVLYWIIWIPVSQRFGRGVEAPADFVENPASFCNTFHYAPTMYYFMVLKIAVSQLILGGDKPHKTTPKYRLIYTLYQAVVAVVSVVVYWVTMKDAIDDISEGYGNYCLVFVNSPAFTTGAQFLVNSDIISGKEEVDSDDDQLESPLIVLPPGEGGAGWWDVRKAAIAKKKEQDREDFDAAYDLYTEAIENQSTGSACGRLKCCCWGAKKPGDELESGEPPGPATSIGGAPAVRAESSGDTSTPSLRVVATTPGMRTSNVGKYSVGQFVENMGQRGVSGHVTRVVADEGEAGPGTLTIEPAVNLCTSNVGKYSVGQFVENMGQRGVSGRVTRVVADEGEAGPGTLTIKAGAPALVKPAATEEIIDKIPKDKFKKISKPYIKRARANRHCTEAYNLYMEDDEQEVYQELYQEAYLGTHKDRDAFYDDKALSKKYLKKARSLRRASRRAAFRDRWCCCCSRLRCCKNADGSWNYCCCCKTCARYFKWLRKHCRSMFKEGKTFFTKITGGRTKQAYLNKVWKIFGGILMVVPGFPIFVTHIFPMLVLYFWFWPLMAIAGYSIAYVGLKLARRCCMSLKNEENPRVRAATKGCLVLLLVSGVQSATLFAVMWYSGVVSYQDSFAVWWKFRNAPLWEQCTAIPWINNKMAHAQQVLWFLNLP